MLPHAITSFDPTRQLAIGDVIFSHHAATIIIKWSKTLQDKSKIHTIALPYLRAYVLCLIQALQEMLSLLPGESNVSLFRIPRSHGLVPLKDSVARRHLKSVSHILGLNPSLTWKSDAVWSCIQSILVAQLVLHFNTIFPSSIPTLLLGDLVAFLPHFHIFSNLLSTLFTLFT